MHKLKSEYLRRTHKYRLRVPNCVKEAREIDDDNGNILWMDTNKKYMNTAMVKFKLIEG